MDFPNARSYVDEVQVSLFMIDTANLKRTNVRDGCLFIACQKYKRIMSQKNNVFDY